MSHIDFPALIWSRCTRIDRVNGELASKRLAGLFGHSIDILPPLIQNTESMLHHRSICKSVYSWPYYEPSSPHTPPNRLGSRGVLLLHPSHPKPCLRLSGKRVYVTVSPPLRTVLATRRIIRLKPLPSQNVYHYVPSYGKFYVGIENCRFHLFHLLPEVLCGVFLELLHCVDFPHRLDTTSSGFGLFCNI
jgi:hypothetical protein